VELKCPKLTCVSFNFSSGGVVMASRDGKIVFENTLDARLELVFRKKLPEVYYVALFSYVFSCLK
jgi:V-type H+-transporting ATPase subunit E